MEPLKDTTLELEEPQADESSDTFRTSKWCNINWRKSWKFFVAILAPVIIYPILFVTQEVVVVPDITVIESDGYNKTINNTKAAHMYDYDKYSCLVHCKFRLAYVILVMAVYWSFEIIPLPVTALFPLVLFPLLGIDDAANVSKSYMRESSTIFLGGAIVALAVEKCNLHRRVALRLIMSVGVSPTRLMLGLMTVVSFLSMWISNTTCVTMLAPVIVAIVDEIYSVEDATTPPDNNNTHEQQINDYGPPIFPPERRRRSTVFRNSALSSYPRIGERRRGSEIVRNSNLLNISEQPELNHRQRHRGSAPCIIEHSSASIQIPEETQPSADALTISIPTNDDNSQQGMSSSPKAKKLSSIKNMYLFGLAYAAIFGGTATITGTGPNKIFKEAMKPYSKIITQDGRYRGITFFTWMALNVPPMIINVILAWLYLIIKYIGFSSLCVCLRKPKDKATLIKERLKEKHAEEYIRNEYKQLGRITFHQISVSLIFLLVILLWLLRDPQLFPGWNQYVSSGMSGDSTPALMGAVLLFIIPKSWGFLTSDGDEHFEALLDWKFVTDKLPWGLFLLLGSGYAIGDSAHRTGLTKRIGKYLLPLNSIAPPWVLLMLLPATSLITEVVSNTAAASIILPILFGLSHEWKIHPLYFTISASVAASYAFMLPVAFPVNAVIFAAGDFTIWEMIKNGYVIKAISLFVVFINSTTLGEALFQYMDFSNSVHNVTRFY